MSSAAIRPATESLADIGADRVGGLTQLVNVHEPRPAVVDEPIDLTLDRLRWFEGEMPVVVRARRYGRHSPRTITAPPRLEAFRRAASQSRRLAVAPFGSRAVWQSRRLAVAPFGSRAVWQSRRLEVSRAVRQLRSQTVY
jgi:hypothetical protein